MTDSQSAYYAARATQTPDLRVSFSYEVRPPMLLGNPHYKSTHQEFDEEMNAPEIFGQMAQDVLSAHAGENEWDNVKDEWRTKQWLGEIGSHEGLSPVEHFHTFTEKTLITAIIALEQEEDLPASLVEDVKEVVQRAEAFKAQNEQLLDARQNALNEFYMK